MRKYLMWIMLVFCLTCNSAYGFFGAADEYVILLTSNDSLDVQYAGKLMHKKFNGNSTVNDIAAKRLWNEFNATPSLNRDATVWLVKAVGGSGSLRYQELMQQALGSSDKKVRYWAKLGLRRMNIPNDPFTPSEIDLDQIKKELEGKVSQINIQFENSLANASGRKLRQETERLFYLVNVLSPETLTIVATKLEKNLDTQDRELTEALSWICRTLGRTKNPLYRSSLLAAKKQGNKKLSSWAKKSLQQLTSGNDD